MPGSQHLFFTSLRARPGSDHPQLTWGRYWDSKSTLNFNIWRALKEDTQECLAESGQFFAGCFFLNGKTDCKPMVFPPPPQLLPVVSPLLVANIFVVRPAQLIDVFIDELSETAGKHHPVSQRLKLENHPL